MQHAEVRNRRWFAGSGDLLGLLRTLILARLLLPREFGLAAAAGVVASLIHDVLGGQPGPEGAGERGEQEVDNWWSYRLVGCWLAALILLLSARQVAAFFNAEEIYSFLMVLAAWCVVDGLVHPAFYRAGDGLYYFLGQVVDFLVVIGVALLWRSGIALVMGMLAAGVFRLAVSYRLASSRPHFLVSSLRKFRLSRAGFMTWCRGQGDRLVVGRVLGMASLGIYSLAWQMAEAVVGGTVSFCYQLVGRQPQGKMQQAGQLDRQLAWLFLLPMVGGTIILAEDAINIFLGPNWVAAAPLLQIFSLAAFLRVAAGTMGTAADTAAVCPLALVTFLALLPLGLIYGAAGIAWAVVGGSAVELSWRLRADGVAAGELLSAGFFPLVGTLVMLVGAGFLKAWWAPLNLLGFAGTIMIMGTVYGFFMYLVWRTWGYRGVEQLKDILQTLR